MPRKVSEDADAFSEAILTKLSEVVSSISEENLPLVVQDIPVGYNGKGKHLNNGCSHTVHHSDDMGSSDGHLNISSKNPWNSPCYNCGIVGHWNN